MITMMPSVIAIMTHGLATRRRIRQLMSRRRWYVTVPRQLTRCGHHGDRDGGARQAGVDRRAALRATVTVTPPRASSVIIMIVT